MIQEKNQVLVYEEETLKEGGVRAGQPGLFDVTLFNQRPEEGGRVSPEDTRKAFQENSMARAKALRQNGTWVLKAQRKVY